MERYKPFPQTRAIDCFPPQVADWYAEKISPGKFPDRSPRKQQLAYHQKLVQQDFSTHLPQIAAPYNLHLNYLRHTLEQLSPQDAPQDKTYQTTLGILTFSQLYERTRKYAASILHHTYHMYGLDIDDGLQTGYLHLWERLEKEPMLLKDKQISWIGKGVAYKALHAVRGDWKYRKVLTSQSGTASSHRNAHSVETKQTDMRTDLHQAIAAVATDILTHQKGKQADRALWALYGLTMLHANASELSRMFQVREQSMSQAYNHVRKQLQKALPNYAPHGQTKVVRKHGPDTLPKPDMKSIQQANKNITGSTFEAVRTKIAEINADTRIQDELALEGIQKGITISDQARANNIRQYKMQRAYKRVHLLIAAEQDPTVRTLRPERRTKFVFTLTPENSVRVEQLALELLNQPKSYEKLVALHAHISNLPISTTAKHFNIPTSTLRYYNQQIGKQLKTPIVMCK